MGPEYGLLQLVAPVDLAKLKATTPTFGHHGIELLAVHKKEVHTGLVWKEHRTPQLLFRDGEKVPKQAVLRLRIPHVGDKIARQLPLAEEPDGSGLHTCSSTASLRGKVQAPSSRLPRKQSPKDLKARREHGQQETKPELPTKRKRSTTAATRAGKDVTRGRDAQDCREPHKTSMSLAGTGVARRPARTPSRKISCLRRERLEILAGSLLRPGFSGLK